MKRDSEAMDTRVTPATETNLTRLEDLACAAYSSHALTPRRWDTLSEHERKRWRSIVGYVLDIALDTGEHDDGPAMARIRADAIGARQIAEARHERYSAHVELDAKLAEVHA